MAKGTELPDLKARLETVADSFSVANTNTDSPGVIRRSDGMNGNLYSSGDAFMGSVLVAQGDDILLNKGYGLSNLKTGVANAPDVKFRIGSLTKQFTAAMVLLLQQDGKLQIDDLVSKYLPETPTAWRNVTLAQLLGHTSGIPNFTMDKTFPAWSLTQHTPNEVFALFRDKPLNFEPGSKFEYSNSNYCVLGLVIEKVSGKRYGDLLRDRIFNPLGMKDSGLDADGLVLPRRAQGYMLSKEVLEPAVSSSMSVLWTVGGIYSTAQDLLRWERGLFGGKLLSQNLLALMTTRGMGMYGLGVAVLDRDGIKLVQHDGTVDGFDASMVYVPDRQITVIVLSNVNGTAPTHMACQLLDIMLGKSVLLMNERVRVSISQEELKAFEGDYITSSKTLLTFISKGQVLTTQITGERLESALPLLYEGVKNGHPWFYQFNLDSDIEFLPSAGGEMTSLIYHRHGFRASDISANRR